jgi:hypothetical protein
MCLERCGARMPLLVEHVAIAAFIRVPLGYLSADIIWEMSMKADWRASLVSEAIRAFSSDLNLAVSIVTPRKRVEPPNRIVWGAPPRLVGELAPLGRSGDSDSIS